MTKTRIGCLVIVITTLAVLTGAFFGGGWKALLTLFGILIVLAAYGLGISLLVNDNDKRN